VRILISLFLFTATLSAGNWPGWRGPSADGISPEKNERHLLCLDRRTGKTIWDNVVVQSPPESIHRLNSRASGTPATDGKQIYVTFMRAEGDKVVAPNVGSERLITPG